MAYRCVCERMPRMRAGWRGHTQNKHNTWLDGYDVFRNSAQRQTDDEKRCSERNAWEDSKARATHREIRHETRVCNQTLRLRMDARIGNRDVKHKMRG